VGRIFLALLVVTTIAAHAAEASSPLVIDIRDYEHVPKAEMDRAITVLTRIFEVADVSVTARLQSRSAAEGKLSAPLPEHAVIVCLHSSLAALSLVDDPNILGMAPGAANGGRLAYVFPTRVETLAKRNRVDAGMLLGVVLAHEVGHILLPARRHAATGVMRPVCDRFQVRKVILGTLAFTPRETAIIQAGLF